MKTRFLGENGSLPAKKGAGEKDLIGPERGRSGPGIIKKQGSGRKEEGCAERGGNKVSNQVT